MPSQNSTQNHIRYKLSKKFMKNFFGTFFEIETIMPSQNLNRDLLIWINFRNRARCVPIKTYFPMLKQISLIYLKEICFNMRKSIFSCFHLFLSILIDENKKIKINEQPTKERRLI